MFTLHVVWDAKYCDQRVCLSVCLSAGISQKPHVQNFTQFLCMSTVAAAWSFFDASTICYVLSVLSLTSCFHILGPVGQNQRRLYVRWSSPDGGTGAK